MWSAPKIPFIRCNISSAASWDRTHTRPHRHWLQACESDTSDTWTARPPRTPTVVVVEILTYLLLINFGVYDSSKSDKSVNLFPIAHDSMSVHLFLRVQFCRPRTSNIRHCNVVKSFAGAVDLTVEIQPLKPLSSLRIIAIGWKSQVCSDKNNRSVLIIMRSLQSILFIYFIKCYHCL
jgi:hypothetical protein